MTRIQLLGSPVLRTATTEVVIPHTRPGWLALYLAAHNGWVSRLQLAKLFGKTETEPASLHYVRNLLNRASKFVAGPTIEVDRGNCRWNVRSDLNEFRRAVAAGNWAQALQAYEGRFLEDVEMDGAPLLEAWLDEARSEVHELWQFATLQYAIEQEGSGNYARAATALADLLEEDRLHEEAVQIFLRNAYLAGKRHEALELGERFTRELAIELGLEPLPATQMLLRQIREGADVAHVAPNRPHTSRWTDKTAQGASDEHEALVRLLNDRDTRFLALTDRGESGNYHLIISRRASRPAVALTAIVELASSLLAAGHRRRALQLLGAVLSAKDAELFPEMLQQAESLWRQATHSEQTAQEPT